MQELADYIHNRCISAGVHLDKYDPDFIIGVIMEWLNDHNAVLTASGLES